MHIKYQIIHFKNIRKTFFILLLFIFSLSTHYLAAENNPTHKKILDNGFRCLIKEFPKSGLVAVNLRINNGSINENEFLGYGISHLIEHLAFKSTTKYSLGQIETEIKSIGGIMNATTSLDSITFFITAPTQNFEKMLDILKEMVFNATFGEKEFKDEKQVILKEMILHEDNPQRKLHRILWETAYNSHPYKYPVIGYPQNFKLLKRSDLLQYYNTKFLPNNMVLAIAGDVRKDSAFKLVKKLFGKTKSPNFFKAALEKEPQQITSKEAIEKSAVNIARIALAFHSTNLLHEDLYALDTLAVILGQGNASRLNEILVKKLQLVRSVQSFNYTPKYKGLFVIMATLEPQNINKVKTIILKELELLKEYPPSKKEIQRAKTLIISDHIYSQQSLQAIASSLSLQETMTKDPDFNEKYIENIKSVTPKQISEAAKKYFSPNKLTLAQIIPKKFKDKEKNILDKKETNDLASTSITLKNGIRLISIKNSKTPSGYITISFLGGKRAETAKDNGLSAITSKMLLKGTRSRSEKNIKSAFEARGANINSFSGKNSFGLTVRFLKEDLCFTLKMLKDILKNPKFPINELKKLKKLTLLDINSEEDSIFKKASNALKKLIYEGHPYSLRDNGTKLSVKTISQKDIRTYYEKFAVTENMVVSICGDFKIDEALSKLKKTFEKFKYSSNLKIIKHKNVSNLNANKTLNIEMDKKEALILLGFSGIAIKSTDRFPFEILTSIMSGSNGRLFHSIRDTQGLSYAQNFFFNPEYDKGSFGIYVATSPENKVKALNSILKQLEILANNGVTKQEIKNAKTELIARRLMSYQHNSFLSLQASLNTLYGISIKSFFDYEKNIMKVNKKDVNNIISKYIRNKPHAIVVITPE